MIVEISADAEADIEAIGEFIAKDSRRRALTLVQGIRSSCVQLGEAPEAFSLVPRYEQYGIRRRLHGNYLIFYKVGGERVFVVRVLHGAMDYDAIVFPP